MTIRQQDELDKSRQTQPVPAPEVPSVVVGKKNGRNWEFATVLKGRFNKVTTDDILSQAVQEALRPILDEDTIGEKDVIQMEIKIIREGE